MLYRLRVDLCFNEENTPKGFFNQLEAILDRAVKLTVPINNPEITYIETHRCYHDEQPSKPCEIIKRIEVI